MDAVDAILISAASRAPQGHLLILFFRSAQAPDRGVGGPGAGAFRAPASLSSTLMSRGKPLVPLYGGRGPGHAAGDGSASAYKSRSMVVPVRLRNFIPQSGIDPCRPGHRRSFHCML